MDRRAAAPRDLETIARELRVATGNCMAGTRHLQNAEIARAVAGLERRADEYDRRAR